MVVRTKHPGRAGDSPSMDGLPRQQAKLTSLTHSNIQAIHNKLLDTTPTLCSPSPAMNTTATRTPFPAMIAFLLLLAGSAVTLYVFAVLLTQGPAAIRLYEDSAPILYTEIVGVALVIPLTIYCLVRHRTTRLAVAAYSLLLLQSTVGLYILANVALYGSFQLPAVAPFLQLFYASCPFAIGCAAVAIHRIIRSW